MVLHPSDILNPLVDDGSSVERINNRKLPLKIVIVEPNLSWPQRFLSIKSRISRALDSFTIIEIQHAGSTSVPNLPAKDVIDVDLVVRNINDEDSYVPGLIGAGFTFLFREPAWYQHRFFVDEGDRPGGYPVNLHVFGPECAEVERHRIFREWLLKTPKDLELYARIKRECAAEAEEKGESMQEYTDRKRVVIQEILDRAFQDLGYIDG